MQCSVQTPPLATKPPPQSKFVLTSTVCHPHPPQCLCAVLCVNAPTCNQTSHSHSTPPPMFTLLQSHPSQCLCAVLCRDAPTRSQEAFHSHSHTVHPPKCILCYSPTHHSVPVQCSAGTLSLVAKKPPTHIANPPKCTLLLCYSLTRPSASVQSSVGTLPLVAKKPSTHIVTQYIPPNVYFVTVSPITASLCSAL